LHIAPCLAEPLCPREGGKQSHDKRDFVRFVGLTWGLRESLTGALQRRTMMNINGLRGTSSLLFLFPTNAHPSPTPHHIRLIFPSTISSPSSSSSCFSFLFLFFFLSLFILDQAALVKTLFHFVPCKTNIGFHGNGQYVFRPWGKWLRLRAHLFGLFHGQ